MRRREFIAGLSGATVAWPLTARAQQQPVPVIGFVNSGSSDASASMVAAFHQGLRQSGYVEGQNLTVQYRWADGQYDKLPALVRELMSRQVVVIFAGGPPAAQAAKATTSTIPIVFTSGGDAVKLGLVASLNRPGGNVTGISFLVDELVGKRLGLLHDVVPQASVFAMLVNPNFVDASDQLRGAQEAARAAGLQLHVINASTERDLDTAFARIAELRVGALLVSSDTFLFARLEQLVALAARYALPTIYNLREFAEAGGLMSYDTSINDAYRQAGIYVGRILQGAKPGDLPVTQPTTYKLVINLKTAKVLGLTIPETLLATADEVIQ
jgi:putative tryptophan/tyrosine transport system substrate-binding protein